MKPATSPLGVFERYLSVWVALGIAAGVASG
jgi:ACR3 family arsenite efflux pump ArsB